MNVILTLSMNHVFILRLEKREEIIKTMNGVQNTVAVTTTTLIMKVVLPKIIYK